MTTSSEPLTAQAGGAAPTRTMPWKLAHAENPLQLTPPVNLQPPRARAGSSMRNDVTAAALSRLTI